MIIAYDVSHIRRLRAGIGRFNILILQGLLSSDRKRNYVLHGWSPEIDTESIQSLLQSNVRLSIARVPGTIKRLYWNALRIPTIDMLIGPFDVFHSAEPLLPPIGSKRSIITFYDIAYYKFPNIYSRWIAKKWDYLYRRSLRIADAVVVPSESTRDDLADVLSFPTERIHVVRPPVDPVFTNEISEEGYESRIRKKFSLPDQFILFVGTIEPRKNIVRLVRAFEMFLTRGDQSISLVIVGRRGWLYENILTTIKTSRAGDRIHLLNYVSDADLVVLYRLALMFVLPSLYEGHGFPVMEAMASGTPVITSNNSSLKEIGEGAALLVDAENVTDICNAMLRVYRDDSLKREMSAAGRKRALQFSVENAVKAVIDLYESLERR